MHLWARVPRRFRRAFEGSASQNHSQSLGDELQSRSMCCKCASLHLQSTNLLGRCAKTSIALVCQKSIIPKLRYPGLISSCQVVGLGAREQAFVSLRTVIGGSVYGDRVLPGYYEIHCHNRDLAILPAFSSGDRRQKRGRGTFYADPSIQRSKDRISQYACLSHPLF